MERGDGAPGLALGVGGPAFGVREQPDPESDDDRVRVKADIPVSAAVSSIPRVTATSRSKTAVSMSANATSGSSSRRRASWEDRSAVARVRRLTAAGMSATREGALAG